MLVHILNAIHFILIFLPIAIFFIPMEHFKYSFKYVFLILILIPIHWVFLNNQCLFTVISKKMGDMKQTETDSSFSEKYLKWLYEPIMNVIGWDWNDKGLDKMVNLHWLVNFVLIWYYLFFIGKDKLIN